MLVYIDGPVWFMLGIAALMLALIVLYCVVASSSDGIPFPRFKRKSKKVDVAEIETSEQPIPAREWKRTAAPLGESESMPLTALNRVPRRKDGPRLRLVKPPETPLSPAVMTEPARLTRVEKFGVWLTAFDQFGRVMPAYSGPMHSVGAKIYAAGFHEDFKEVHSSAAVFNKKLMERAVDIRELSPQ